LTCYMGVGISGSDLHLKGLFRGRGEEREMCRMGLILCMKDAATRRKNRKGKVLARWPCLGRWPSEKERRGLQNLLLHRRVGSLLKGKR